MKKHILNKQCWCRPRVVQIGQPFTDLRPEEIAFLESLPIGDDCDLPESKRKVSRKLYRLGYLEGYSIEGHDSPAEMLVLTEKGKVAVKSMRRFRQDIRHKKRKVY